MAFFVLAKQHWIVMPASLLCIVEKFTFEAVLSKSLSCRGSLADGRERADGDSRLHCDRSWDAIRVVSSVVETIHFLCLLCRMIGDGFCRHCVTCIAYIQIYSKFAARCVAHELLWW
jgi:hypothetical protein